LERWGGILLVLLALGALLWAWSMRRRRASGLPSGRIAYGDTGRWQACSRTLESPAHRLTGRPDYLVQSAHGMIPVELKSGLRPRRAHDGQRLQLAAYCLLVEATYGARPPYGIIQYRDGGIQVPNDEGLRSELLRTLAEMRGCLDRRSDPVGYQGSRRCTGCGHRSECSEP
jgi:CRISPR-associated exonuclease Cas4